MNSTHDSTEVERLPIPDCDDSTLQKAPEEQIHTLESRLSRAQSRAGRHNSEKDEELNDDHTPEEQEHEATRQIRGLKWLLVCLALYISTFIYGLDTTIAADVQGAVVEKFGHVEQLAWIGAGFPLGSVAVILPLGALYTSFNMKWVYNASLVVFMAGSALCGAAPDMNAMIVGRVIAGMGGSGSYLGALNYLSAVTSPKERGVYITIIGFTWGIGAVLGPVIGGAFSVSPATWRWAFYINLVVGAAMTPVYIFGLPPLHPIKGVSIRSRIINLDFMGFVLSAALWVMLTIPLTMAGSQWSWNDGRTIASFVVLGAVLVLYVLQQYLTIFTTTETRSFPIHLLKSRTQILLCIGTAANITTLFVVVYFIPIYFQFVHNDSALMAAVRLLPYVAIMVFFNLLAGRLLARIQYYMPIYIASGFFVTLGGALLMAYLDPRTSESNIYGFTVLIAVGGGLTLQIGYAVAGIKAGPRDLGDAISLHNVAQMGASVIALVIAGQVFQSTAFRNLSEVLEGTGYSAKEIHAAVAGAQSELFAELNGELRERAILAITQGMQKSFILVITSGAVLIVAGAFMRVERLFGEIITA